MATAARKTIDLGRVRAGVLGALVGDAATLGFQWLYDPARIASIEPKAPEFHPPNAADFEGVMGYYIGTNKAVGDLSNYGEQIVVALKASKGQKWNPTNFLAIFQQSFNRGGLYVGYIDGMTNKVLENIATANTAAVAEAVKAGGIEDEDQKGFLGNYLQRKATELEGEALVAALVPLVSTYFKDPSLEAKVAAAARYYDTHRPLRVGADDDQICGLCKLPIVIGLFAGRDDFEAKITEATRLTNNNDIAVTYALFYARVLEAVILDGSVTVRQAVELALKRVGDAHELHALIAKALAFDTRAGGAAATLFKDFNGGSCPVKNTVPITIAIAAGRDDISFVEASRLNIATGGDSCGRAVLLGALLGVTRGVATDRGVPLSWIGRLSRTAEVLQAIDDATQ